MKKTILLSTLIVLSVITLFGQSRYGCQNSKLSGQYLLLSDSDGTTPRDDATITLTLSGKTATIHAIMPDVDVSSGGSFSACENLITIEFDDFDFAAENESFELIENTLTLPFLVLGGADEGFSTWQRISGGDNSDDQANNDQSDSESDGGNSSDSNGGNDGGSGNNNGDNSDNNDSNGNNNDNNNPDNNGNNPNGNNYPSNTNEIEPYVGDYIGTSWGWEVRFKHTSGDFVSQFTGADKDELPFEGDKIIMTLMVQHAVKFKIHINEDGQVDGEGEIIYNLIPNLCGVAVLTEQVNSAINLMGEVAFFFELGATIGKESVKRFEAKLQGVQSNLAINIKSAYEVGTPILQEYAGINLPDKIKNINEDAQKSAALCNCAAGIANVEAGNQVGPATLQELVTSVGIDAAKAILIDFGKPGGFMLSIPGLTQIQYYYKGLQNGPETRKFNIMGYLVDGQLYLEMDGGVFGGSEDLVIEYMVNYEKETPTFPTWTPFLQDPGVMYPAGSETTLYREKIVTKTESYVDKVTGERKTIDVDYTETEETKEKLPFPFAVFREAGTQRNGVSVWHEYEYNWEVYKTNSEE